MSTVGSLKQIFIYPIKSLPGIELDRCIVTKYGIVHPDNSEVVDRKWMLTNEEGSFLTQRAYPTMALISISLDGDNFKLKAPNMPDLTVPIKLKNKNKKIMCRVWKCHIPGYIYEEEICQWFSKFLEKEHVNLVVFDSSLNDEARKILNADPNCDAKESDVVVYGDASSFMLITESSLIDVNTRLKNPVTIQNFRPNFYAENCDEAYAEDNWLNFKIGNVHFNKIKPCTRCILTTVDPKTGVKNADMEPLITLRTYRLNKEKYGSSPMLGIHISTFDDAQFGLKISLKDSIVLF